MVRNIGLEVKTPEAECQDGKCPFHGKLRVRGRIFEGKIESDASKNTATVKWEYFKQYSKYERLGRMTSKVNAHNPVCISAKEGDKVKIAECRPLSKTKKFVIIEVLQ